ncbi:MAG: hypothetical protein GDA41_04415 [Rhodospirillales bacterium]|nr:hypothetical protein [Rhodospirillales bacterium]
MPDLNALVRRAEQLDRAMGVLSSFDEGPDRVLCFKQMLLLEGHPEYTRHFNASDTLSDSQRTYATQQRQPFKARYREWPAEETACP